MKEEVEEKRESGSQMGVAQTTIQSFNQAGKTTVSL